MTADRQPRRATLRAILIALGSVGFLSWITPYNDYDLQNTYIAGNLFPMGAMVVLLLLALVVNPILSKVAPQQRFSPAELGLIWCVIAIASGIPAAGFLRYMLPAQAGLVYYATPENHWLEQMAPQLKPFLAPQDPVVCSTFFSGAANGTVPWAAWRPSLVMWSVCAAQLFFASACVTVLLRRQWVDRERFSFPLVQLPLEVAEAPPAGRALNAFFRHPLVWAGAAVPIAVHGLNGLHLYFPGVPQIDLHYDLNKNLPTSRPWNAIGSFPLHIFPATIGFAYLLAQEIAFSMAFFRFFEVAQRVFLVTTNLAPAGNDLTRFGSHQAYGAVLALGIMVVLLARPHLKEVWLRVRGQAGGAPDDHEAMSYRVACWGLVFSVLGLFATFVQFGIGPLMTVVIIVVGLMKYVATSWGATNAGLMMMQQQFRPSDLLVSAMGSRAFTPGTLVNTALVENVFWYDIRETLMPSLMNSAKLAEDTGGSQKAAFRWGAVAIALAAALAMVAWLNLCYGRGATQLAPSTFVGHVTRVWREAYARLDPGQPQSGFYLLGAGLGAAMFFGLMTLRLRFVNWPLHPIGLVSMYSWTSNQFGVSFLVGWAVKAVIVKAGGLRLYRKLRPFFLGIILGDVIMSVVLTIIGFVYGQGYFVTPS